MPALPTRGQTAALVTQLRKADWTSIEIALAAAIVRERAGGVERDGYPRSVGFDAVGRGNGASDPTYVAANAHQPVDVHRSHTYAAVNDLTACVDALARLVTRLHKLQRLITADADQVPSCEPCAAGGVHHASVHWGDVAGRLREPVHMCRDAYEFVRRHGRVPNRDEAKTHDATGRWKVHVLAPQRRPRSAAR